MEHRPVLLAEVLSYLVGGVLVDATIGLGGHARSFLEAFPEGRVIGIDRDAEILEKTRERLSGFGARVELHHAPFSRLASVVGARRVDGVLFDFGVNSAQLDAPERGFSFRHEGPLDMRMDRDEEETAADLVNRRSEKDLGNLLYELGEERAARRIAAAIVAERRRAPIETTTRLAEIVRRVVRHRGRIDAATRTFQALRMAVNREADEIAQGLEGATSVLRAGGRLVAISFHSGEDRVVKRFLREDPRLEPLTRKPVRPGPDEVRANPRARSSRLRAAERRSGDA